MAYATDKKPGELTALTTLAVDDVFVVGDTSDASEVAKGITKANLITDLTTSFAPALGADDNYVTDAEKAALHAAVTVADSAEIDLTLTGQQISASIIAGSIDETKLDTSVNASLDLADTSLQDADATTTPTASKLVQRDASANIYVNNYFANTTSTVSAAGTTVLTVASARTQNLTGSSNQTFQLPDATTLSLSSIFEFNNNSSGSLTITNAGAVSQYVVPAGGAVLCFCTSIGSANGTWDFHAQAPASATWSSGATGLVMNSVLTTSPSVGSGASSSTAPSFIPQRGASTTGFGGDGTNLHATIAGTSAMTIAAAKTTVPGLLVSGLTASELTATDASKNIVSLPVATYPSLTETSYVKGVTSAIQTQLNAKLTATDYDDATAAEVNTGTSTAKYVSPDSLAGSNLGIRYYPIALNGSTALTTSDKFYFRVPAALNGMNLVSVSATVGTGAAGSSSSGTPTFTVKNITQASAAMLSTALTVDASEYTSATAVTAAVIDTANDDVATDDLIEVACTTAGTGVTYTVCTLGFQLP